MKTKWTRISGGRAYMSKPELGYTLIRAARSPDAKALEAVDPPVYETSCGRAQIRAERVGSLIDWTLFLKVDGGWEQDGAHNRLKDAKWSWEQNYNKEHAS
jgi:hypothetical protein